ncbi:hypothetical protein [Actinoplanes sp. NPDC051494]|uniref:hypothetical protein n=1 Tax=Actinoplanes sp. NPDC051494 TaxID=3363907 RepID=UPI0037963538
MAAISAVSSSSEAQTELVKYQQKLAADLAAKAAEKVITADKDAVARAQQSALQATQQAQQSPQVTSSAATASVGSTFDVTV